MAPISERGGVWRAQVRKAGQPSISKTFDTRAAAVAWTAAYETKEPEIIAGPVTLADLMDRYSTEVSPNKASGRWEVIRIMAMRPSFIEIEAIKLDRATIAMAGCSVETGVTGHGEPGMEFAIGCDDPRDLGMAAGTR